MFSRRRRKGNMRPPSSLHALVFDGSRNILVEAGLGARPLSPRLRHHPAAFQCDHPDATLSSTAVFFSKARLR